MVNLNKWLKIVQQTLASCLRLPTHCLLCLSTTPHSVVCEECENRLPFLKTTFSLDISALFAYEPPLIRFITGLKFKNELYIAKWLAHQMRKHWPKPEVDCIVAIPLHPHRQQHRGYNQTLEIAKLIGRSWNIPLDRWSCTRIKNTRAQTELSASRRKQNIKASSFCITSNMRGKRVLVIEDVITTGTTVQAFKEALYNAGASHVIIWACCQTMKS